MMKNKIKKKLETADSKMGHHKRTAIPEFLL